MRPSVAVVIAARDPGLLLDETLDSVGVQRLQPTEVVVVDDGSTDGSCRRATTGRDHVVLLERPPRGRAAARNAGAAATAADAILFLDADDLLTPEALSTLAGVIVADPTVELVHGLVAEFADATNPPPPTVRVPGEPKRARLGGTTLVRRSLWDRVGPLNVELPTGEWIDWMDRAYAARPVVREVDEVVLRRRLHGGNGTNASGSSRAYLDVARAALARRRASGHE